MYTDSSGSHETIDSLEELPSPARFANAKNGGRRIVEEYELGKTLGKGHFGQVKLAQRITTSQICALKIIEHKATMSPRQHELFNREINALTSIHHPNVISLRRVVPKVNFPHEDGRDREVLLLDLELCSGGELFDFVLSGGPFPEPVAKHCFREIINGLKACHELDIYHRDLKPENIFISTSLNQDSNQMIEDLEFVLKLGDFGLASINEHGVNLCKTAVGTRSYQAPEIVNANGSPYDGGKADVWSAGVILFILLVGNPPFIVADRSDWWFNAVRLNRHKDFWMAHQRPPCAKVNEAAMHFLNKIFIVDPVKRISLDELMNDPWLVHGDIDSDAQIAKLFFNEVTLKTKTDRENNLQEAKKNAHERSVETEVVFAKRTARGVQAACSDGQLSKSKSRSKSNYDTMSTSSQDQTISTQKDHSPPQMDITDAINVLHQGVGGGAGNNLLGGTSFRLFTATTPDMILSWIGQDLENQNHHTVKVNKEKFKAIIEVQNPSLTTTSPLSLFFQMKIQIWSLRGEEGICMVEVSHQDDDSQSTFDGSILDTQANVPPSSSQIQVQQQNQSSWRQPSQWAVSSFWFQEFLPILKARGCVEASTALSQYDQDNQAMTTTTSLYGGPSRSPMLFPPLPPPRDDDPMFNEDLRVQLENVHLSEANDSSGTLDESETTVLGAGHDDIF